MLLAAGRLSHMEHSLASLLSVTEEEGQGSHTQQSFKVKWVTGKHAPENPEDQAKVDIVE